MAIATFVILDELNIAGTIVTITYAAIMGAVAFGMAIAFGLGGREVAGRSWKEPTRVEWSRRTTSSAM